jgi:hypothetical protein
MKVICYKQVIDFMDFVSQAAYVNMVYFSSFPGLLIVFNALLGSLSEVDLLMLFILELIVQGEMHKVLFLLGHATSLLMV